MKDETPVRPYNQEDSKCEIVEDWTWRWEFDDKLEGIVFNAGTKDNPEMVCMR